MTKLKGEDLQEGEVYYVSDPGLGSFWMIGKATSSFRINSDGYRSEATFITARKEFNAKTWAYKLSQRTYRLATPEEVYWLEQCIEAKAYVEKPAEGLYTIKGFVIATVSPFAVVRLKDWFEPIKDLIPLSSVVSIGNRLITYREFLKTLENK